MSLGSLLAQARKDAGLSLEQLAARTNIRMTVLQEIERDNFKNCGGETYARGHIRNISVILGVDPLLFLSLYEQEQSAISKSIQELLVENNVMRKSENSHKVSWKILIVISLTSLAIVAVAQIIISNRSDSKVSIAQPKPSKSVVATLSPSESASSSASPTATNATTTVETVEVKISATRAKSWLFVSDSAGRTLFSGQLSLGNSKTFNAEAQINIRVGNAGGVDLVVNGKNLGAIGSNGQVVSVSYGVNS